MPPLKMDKTPRCQRCDAPVTGQAVGGLCANGLLKLALEPPPERALAAADSRSASAEPSGVSAATPVPDRPTAARFETTLWPQVLEAPHNEKALASLCRKYWYPLYAFLRRTGVSSHEAEDLTQGFFVHLLSKQGLETVRPEYGKFRSFLLACLRHFVSDQRDGALAAKRSPGQPLFDLDAQKAEDRYRLEPVERMNPEKIFERRWALTLLEEVLAALESEFVTNGKGGVFRELQPFLCGEEGAPVYKDVAARLAISEGAARVTVHRLRARYRELVRREIAVTLAAGEDLEAEMRHLFAALRNG
jgi:DNA-directed RNA polymerase specialized sigma24 family protein